MGLTKGSFIEHSKLNRSKKSSLYKVPRSWTVNRLSATSSVTELPDARLYNLSWSKSALKGSMKSFFNTSTMLLTLFSDLIIAELRRHFRGLFWALFRPAWCKSASTYLAWNGLVRTHFSYALSSAVKFLIPSI